MSSTTKRTILRWVHILFGLPMVAYIYGQPAETQQYLPYFRYVYVPVALLAGLALWKGHLVTRLFSKNQP